MDSILAKISEGAGIAVLLVLLVAWAAWKWPIMMLWQAYQASIERRDALHERTLEALNSNTSVLQKIAEKAKPSRVEEG